VKTQAEVIVLSSAKPAVESLGIVKGHYECNFLDQTVPVLTHLLALEVVERRQTEAILKHPNTDWLLVVHEGGADAPEKPFRNHYGVRVTDNAEVDRAYQYLTAKRRTSGSRKSSCAPNVRAPIRFFSLSRAAIIGRSNPEAGLPFQVSYPWERPLTPDQFPERGYIPQALTHGTIECNDWQSSVNFYTEGLGMEITSHVTSPKPHNIKHPANPWYVVSLEVPERSRRYLGPLQRFTIAVRSPAKLAEAHLNLRARREEFGISEIGEIESNGGGESFLLCDLNRNWWEIACASR
jgi:catechol 2,3-dioxygenase-like lactoylglutathione lyase family enzyme